MISVDPYLENAFVLDVSTVEGASGEWVCRLEYEGLPGCVVMCRSPVEALDRIEELREECLRRLRAGASADVMADPSR